MQVAEKHQRALDSYHSGRFDEAVSLFSEALHEQETSELWNDWASAQIATRRMADAERGFRRALQLDAGNADAAANLGALLATAGRHAEALRFLEESERHVADNAKDAVRRLAAECRRATANGNATGGEAISFAKDLRRTLALQASTLSHIAMRLLTIEDLLAKEKREHAETRAAVPKETDVIPKVLMLEVFSATTEIRLLAPAPGIPSVTLPELCLLMHLLARSKARTIFEIGTHIGRTTLNLALNSAANARLYTLDFPHEMQQRYGYSAGSLFARSPLKKKITQLFGETMEFDFSKYFGTADFIFIDAGHSYEQAMSDSRSALKLLRNGRGTIVWHDYGWEGVAPALNRLYREEKRLSGMRHITDTSLVYAELGGRRSRRARRS
jgi:predicted O-methyltransferase YrrM